MTWPATIALPGVISHGTVNPDHLIPIYEEHLKKIHEGAYQQIAEEYYSPLSEEERLEYMVALAAMLDVLAPEGYWFGSNPHDPSEIGFFEDGYFE